MHHSSLSAVACVGVDLHPDLAPVAWLLGTWSGTGEGFYPTIADFTYREDVTYGHAGKPLLAYVQKTWATDDGRALHGESGYLRVAGDTVELVVAHANGVVEVETGAVADVLDLRSVSVATSPAAKEVRELTRRIWREGDALRYELSMAAVGQSDQPHLRATLHRT
jgi:hypothetical protein